MRIAFIVSHPIQYHAPMFRALAEHSDLTVFFAFKQTAQAQGKAGYSVSFDWDIDLLSGYSHHFLHNDARTPSVDRFFGCRSPELSRLIADGRFDAVVVSGWNLWVYWQAVRACRRLGVPVLARTDSQLGSPRASWLLMAKSILYPRLLGRFDGFFAVGSKSRDYLLHYGVPSDRIFSAQHVVDRDRFARDSALSDEERNACKAELGLPVDRQVVSFVGRLIGWKRLADVIHALALIEPESRPVLLVVGDGPERQALQQLAEQKGVGSCFSGFCNQAELPRRYAISDLLILPSDGNETWGLVVNEAMAAGVPAVVSDRVGSGAEMIDEGNTGARFPLGDHQVMATAMTSILSRPRADYAVALSQKSDAYAPSRAAQNMLAAVTEIKTRRAAVGSSR